jgi:hypothetical protein
LARDVQRLTPAERLEAQLRHSELLTAFRTAGASQRSRRRGTARRDR